MTERSPAHVPVLRADGVTVVPERSDRAILVDATIELMPGTVHALVGPNGAGKSTLFGVLVGDITPSTGVVTLDDRPIAELRPADLARERAVLLQHNAVSFGFTAAEIVRMGRAPWARTAAEAGDDDVVARAMQVTDVTALAHRTVSSLSGGERARVALARVLAQDTRIILLDEPTAALDLRHQEDVLTIARDRARAGDAVAVVLHDLGAAMAYADTVTLLSRGEVVATGTPADVLTAARIEAVYEQPVDVFPHPITGVPMVVPRR